MAYGIQSYTSQTTGSGVVSVCFQITTDAAGDFLLSGVEGDAGAIQAIVTDGTPAGVFAVRLKFNGVRILFADANIVNTGIDTVGHTCLTGTMFPQGLDPLLPGATQFFAYTETGVGPIQAPPNTTIQMRMDVQTEQWGTR